MNWWGGGVARDLGKAWDQEPVTRFSISGLGNLEGVSTSPLHSRYIQTLEHVYIINIYIYLFICLFIYLLSNCNDIFWNPGNSHKTYAYDFTCSGDIGSQEDGTPHVPFVTVGDLFGGKNPCADRR